MNNVFSSDVYEKINDKLNEAYVSGKYLEPLNSLSAEELKALEINYNYDYASSLSNPLCVLMEMHPERKAPYCLLSEMSLSIITSQAVRINESYLRNTVSAEKVKRMLHNESFFLMILNCWSTNA